MYFIESMYQANIINLSSLFPGISYLFFPSKPKYGKSLVAEIYQHSKRNSKNYEPCPVGKLAPVIHCAVNYRQDSASKQPCAYASKVKDSTDDYYYNPDN